MRGNGIQPNRSERTCAMSRPALMTVVAAGGAGRFAVLHVNMRPHWHSHASRTHRSGHLGPVGPCSGGRGQDRVPRQQACARAFGTGWVTRQPISHLRAGRLGRHHGPARLERFWAMDVETRRRHPGRQADPAEPGTCDPYPGAGEGTGSACPPTGTAGRKGRRRAPASHWHTGGPDVISRGRRYGRPWTRQTL